jgi:hypothetical protein
VTGIGTVDFDLCRGSENWVCYYPPIPNCEISPPSAFETGSPQGGMGSYQNGFPRIYTSNGVVPAGGVSSRYGYEAAGGDVHIIDEACDENYTYDREKQIITEVHADPDFRYTTRYTVYRWRADGLVTFFLDRTIEARRDIRLSERKDGPEVELFSPYMKDWSRDKLRGYSYVGVDGKVLHVGGQDFRNGPNPLFAGELGQHGYVSLWGDPWGNPAVYAVDNNDYYFSVHSNPADICIGLKMPNKIISRGTKITSRLLFTFNSGRGKTDGAQFERFWRASGLATGTPAWKAVFSQGRLVSVGHEALLAAENYGIRMSIRNARLDNPIPMRIQGINPNWEIGMVDISAGSVHRTPPWRGEAYFVFDANDNKPRELYLGNLVTCDRDFVKVSLVRSSAQRAELDVNNPTRDAVKCTVRSVPLPGVLPKASATLTLKPGEVKRVIVKTTGTRATIEGKEKH